MIEPKLRFKADDGSQFPEWEEKVFGDFVNTHLEKTSDKDTYPLYSLTIEAGVQPKTDRYEREFLVKKEGDNYKIVPPNAFVYNPMNLRFGALKVNHEKFSVSVSGYYDVFSLKDNSVLAFWENYLVTPKMLNYYFSIATGSLIEKLRVHYSQFVKIKKPLPSLPEQQKIAEFLSTIDTVIEKQKETVSVWEERKKGVIQKLFSQEVRFKADDGNEFPDWEEKKLGEVCAPLTYGMNAAAVKYDGENKYIRITDIDDESHLYKNDGLVSPDGELDDKYLVSENDILLARTGASVGKSYLYDKKDGKLYYAGFLIKAHVKSENSKFIYYQTLTDRYARWVQVTSMRSGQPGINANEYSEFMVYVPCLAEQQKIADSLSSLDEVIEKQKATLAAWEELKKGLLQQMFV